MGSLLWKVITGTGGEGLEESDTGRANPRIVVEPITLCSVLFGTL